MVSNWQSANIWLSLSPEDLVERSLVPVKREYLLVEQETLVGDEAPARITEELVRNKSQKEKKREMKARAERSLCNKFAAGQCDYSDESCRFSHDLTGYLRTKPAEIDGECPFSLSHDVCPFGITCRWAKSHTTISPAIAAAREQVAQEQLAAAKEKATALAEQMTMAKKTDGEEETDQMEGDKNTQLDPNDPRVEVRGVLVANDGSLPPRGTLLPLKPLETCSKSMNFLPKDVQGLLRRQKYIFPRADAVLNDLGIQIKHKGSAKHNSQKKNTPVASAEDSTRPAAASSPSTACAAGTAHGGVEEALVHGETATKRIRVDEAGASVGTCRVDDEAGRHKTSVPMPLYDVRKESRETEGNQGYREGRMRPTERKRIDWKGKTYLAPLTTNGNLPYRRVCKSFGVDITIGEMAMCTNLLQGQSSEWALLKRHPTEDLYGVQICGGFADACARTCELINEFVDVDFVDINMGCPIDLVCNKGGGSSMLKNQAKIENVVKAASRTLDCPLTVKIRTGYYGNCPSDPKAQNIAHDLIPKLRSWGAVACTLHGRTREQRYSNLADWGYIERCAGKLDEERTNINNNDNDDDEGRFPLIGNGDVYTYEDYNAHMASGKLATCMVARGGLIKPWIFTEIKEQRHWDISAPERLEFLKDFVRYGLDHWGSDERGVENTRRFLLEWQSFLHRYVPTYLIERVGIPTALNWRPPAIVGRSHLETLLSSDQLSDWINLSEMLLGPVPKGFTFKPKHRSNAYAPIQKGEDKSQMHTMKSAQDTGDSVKRNMQDEPLEDEVENG